MPLDYLLMYVVKSVCQASLPLFLTRVSVVIFCFRSMLNGNRLFSSESLSLVPDKWLVHKLRVMATVEPHLNATYYAHHPTLKSVYEKKKTTRNGW